MRSVLVNIDLPENIISHYEKVAAQSNSTVTAVIQRALIQFSTFDGMCIIPMTTEQRQQLDHVLGRNIRDAAELLATISRILRFKLNDMDVFIPEVLAARLYSRDTAGDFPKYVQDTVIQQLEHFTNLR